MDIRPVRIGGPPVDMGYNEYSGEPLTPEIIHKIKTGCPFKVGYGTVTAIHRSPRGNDCWYCEHQFDTEYIFHEQNGNRIYPSRISPHSNTRVKCKWYLDTTNMTLVVYCTHNYGDILETYQTNEFGIFLINHT
jgi:hypothetical protein